VITIHVGFIIAALLLAGLIGFLASEVLFRRQWRAIQRIAGFDEVAAKMVALWKRHEADSSPDGE
jgi:hypothetical protein